MKKLIYFVINPFKSPRISVVGFIRFTTDLLERFKMRNVDGQLDDRIDATESALSNLVSAYTTDVGSLGNRKARKIAKNRFRRTISPEIERLNASLVTIFGPQSEVIREFFPNGRRIFGECADDLLETHLSNLVDKAVAREDEVGPDLLAEATSLRDDWIAIHEASEESTAQKADTEAKRRNARVKLQNELFLNVLRIAELHPDEPDQLGLYMQQHLIGGPATGPVSGTDDPEPAPSGSGSTAGSTSSVSSTGSSSSVGSTGSSGSSFGSSNAGSTGSGGSSSAGSSAAGSSNGGSSSAGSSSAG